MREKLEQLLREHGMRSAQLAREAGMSTSTLDDILKGKTNEYNVGVDKMLRISEILGVTVEELYDRGSAQEPDPEEQRLIRCFRELNAEGREKAVEYLEDLVDTGKYKKHNSADMVQEA